MDAEIEEAQRQIRRSAAVIQDTFEDLTTLQRMHARAPEISPAAHAPEDASSLVTPSTGLVDQRSSGRSQNESGSIAMRSSLMDPGHDVIVISSENSTPVPSITVSTPAPPTPSSSTVSPAQRSSRPSDPALTALGSELRSMTQSFRERVSEFDELRRAIAQYAQERHSRATERARSRSPPPDVTSSLPPLRVYELDSSSSSPASGNEAAPGTSAPRRFDGQIRPLPSEIRSVLDRRSSLLRQRTTSSSETSLGLLVAARAAASSSTRNSVGDTPTITPASISASARSVADTPRPVAIPAPSTSPGAAAADSRSAARHIPSNISSRITRLAQEIQQEGARISQQAESLRSWINDRNARLDALRFPSPDAALAAATAFSGEPGRPTARMDPYPTIATGASYTGFPTSTSESDTSSLLPWTQRPRSGEPDPRPRESPSDGSPVTRPRRIPESAVRARYLRQNVPTSWSATSPSSSNPRVERAMAWDPPPREARERATDGPLSPPSRTIAPPGNQSGDATGATRPTAFQVFATEEELNARRNDVARARNERSRGLAEVDSAEDDAEYTESRNYRVRRRYNADGDEEVVRVSMRPETFPGFAETSAARRAMVNDWEDDSGEEDSWMDALSRLDSMSRRSAARDARDRWEMPRMVRTGAQMGTTVPPTALGPPTYPVNLARRSTRGWGE